MGFWYAAFYFFHYAYHATLLAFLPLYCKDLSFGPGEIAAISASVYAATLFAAPLFVNLAHRYPSAKKLLLGASLLAVLIFYPLVSIREFYAFLILGFVSSFLAKGTLALIESRAIRASEDKHIRFQLVRLFGSLGFVLCVYTLGYLIDKSNTRIVLFSGLALLSVVLLSVFFLWPYLAEKSPASPSPEAEKSAFVWNRSFSLVLVSYTIVWFSHAPFYVYFSLYLQELGWSARWISIAWNTGVLAEIVLFLCFDRISQRAGLITLYRWCIVFAVFRWLLLSVSTATHVILLSQLLHAGSFAGLYLAGLKLVNKVLDDESRDRGQGYLIAVGPGVGSLLGRLAAGVGAGYLSSYAESYILFAAAAAVAFSALLLSCKIQIQD